MQRSGITGILGCALMFGLLPTGQARDNNTAKGVGKKMERGGRALLTVKKWQQSEATADTFTFESEEINAPVPANEIVASWNLETPGDAGLTVYARAFSGQKWTKYYNLGHWSKEGKTFPRESVKGQKDEDGDVETDTLVLKQPAEKVQVRVVLRGLMLEGRPLLPFVAISLTDTHAKPTPMEPNRAVWGKEIAVPGKWQSGWPGASGWCSPTSTAMALAFWGKKLNRPELDLPVPDVAGGIFDRVYNGTGNWPFNTAFAGSFQGIRAYVTRFADIRQLEDWIAAGIPPVVSVSYDFLKGKAIDNDPGHLLVCDGFTETGDIVLNDPAYHPERGEVSRRVFPRANFLKGWARSKNTVYLIYAKGSKLPEASSGHWTTE